tara:strand:+ start:2904 stop:3881 length:978 start_codon:yes stop_codon:yes gene_type:complete
MIIKSFELSKIDLKKNKLILFYGKNNGFKKSATDDLKKKFKNILIYDEKEILENKDNFFDNIFTKSLFETNKFIIIKRGSDKIINIINQIIDKDLDDINILINAENLEKRSKLRTLFEKNKDCICAPFYSDNDQTLSKLAHNFLKEKNISLSPANLNLIINKCNGDRENLINELNKIEYFQMNGKKITSENIAKLINLNENHNLSELINNCLLKNKKRTIYLLNENNFANEESVLIVRTFLNKCKRILELANNYKKNKSIDLTIASAKPPIFWKEIEITKQQIYKLPPKKIKQLITELSELELNIKKNINNSIYLVTDYILELAS